MLLWQPAEAGKRCTLGILDVYGFESLAHNGLERLLINYAAERVQVHTRTHTQPAEAGKRSRWASWTCTQHTHKQG